MLPSGNNGDAALIRCETVKAGFTKQGKAKTTKRKIYLCGFNFSIGRSDPASTSFLLLTENFIITVGKDGTTSTGTSVSDPDRASI